MFERQVKIVKDLLKEIEIELPIVFAKIDELTAGASTGLEYYGMIKNSINEAHEKGEIPNKYKEKIDSMNSAIEIMYGS